MQPHNNTSAGIVGDGIHDDTAGIQALLDERKSLVYLPSPPTHYRISRPLVIHSGQELRLDRYTLIRLAPQSNCLMLTNDNHGEGNHDIAVTGGIWDMDNVQQAANPIHGLIVRLKQKIEQLDYDPARYLGICMRFVGVTRFVMRDLTFRDPVTFCTQFAKLTHFTIENIHFDFQHWNPHPFNMDGIHLDGGCRFGRIANLHGATYDDLIALNADDAEGESPFHGPIEDITIDGIYCTDCHSGIRLLSAGSPVRRISISNVHGTFFQYAVGFTKWAHHRPTDGIFDDITLRDIRCAKAPRHTVYQRDHLPHFAVVWFERGTHTKNVRIEGFHRHEEINPVETIMVRPGAHIESFEIVNATLSNTTGKPVNFLVNEGHIGRLAIGNLHTTWKGGEPLTNHGAIDQIEDSLDSASSYSA